MMTAGTRCCCLRVAELDDSGRFCRAMDMIPWDDRKKKTERYVHRKDQLLCLGAGLLLNYLLEQENIPDKRLETDACGKPKLAGASGLHFNLSHSGEFAVCALSDSPVGIDIEAIGKPDFAVAKRFFSADELNWLENEDDRTTAFFRLWTLKESYIKKTGTGLSVPLSSFSVFPREPGAYTFTDLSAAPAPKQNTHFREFRLPGYCIALCSCGEMSGELRQISSAQILGL